MRTALLPFLLCICLAPLRLAAQAHDAALREQKLKNRHKRRKDLSMEQFNLP